MTDIVDDKASRSADPLVSVERRRSFLGRFLLTLWVAPALVVFVVVFVTVNLVTALVAALVVAGAALVAVRSATTAPDRRLLASFASDPVDTARHARLVNLVDGLALVSGVSRPELRVCAGDRPFAMVLASDDTTGVIVVSEGATTAWDRMENEAVLAHLLVRLRSGDAALTASVLTAATVLRRFGLGFAATWLVGRLLEPTIVHTTDVAACRMTRYPPAMVSALEKLRDFPASGRAVSVPQVMAPLAFAPIDDDATRDPGFPNVELFHPPLADRIALCKEI